MSYSWLKHLKERRGQKTFIQAIRMLRFHQTPFHVLLKNITEVLQPYEARFTFPLVASIALKSPALTRRIISFKHEIAVHGFKHLKYPYLTKSQQEDDIQRALGAFKKMGIQVNGFRAPYNAYNEDTPKLIEKYRFLWDGGIGYSSNYRQITLPFHVELDHHQSRFICVPLNGWSDDLMIDTYGFNSHQIAKALKNVLNKAKESHGLVMFDLHPIRMGQPQYINGLKQVVAYGTELNGWFPTVTEAMNYWKKNRNWKDGASFCCLLTGDIDNFVFLDYLRRFL